MDLKLSTSTNDLDLTGGTVHLVDGAEAISQNLRIRLRFFLAEWFLDQRIGIPYFQKILGNKLKQSLIEQIFKKVIVTTPGVTELLAFATSFNGPLRELTISFRCRISTGEILTFEDAFIIT